MAACRALGDILVAAGGPVFFIASFLTWVSLDPGIDVGRPERRWFHWNRPS